MIDSIRPHVRGLPAVLILGSLLAAAGCLQLDTTVSFQEDGSAVITERLNFSQTLLDMASQQDPQLQLEGLLTREAATRRMQHMGKGIALVSHKIQDGRNGSRESVTVFKIPDLNDFTYVSPWLAYSDYATNNVIQWNVVPLYKSRPYGAGTAGELSIEFRHVRRQPAGRGRENPDPVISPLDQQAFRELSPVFRDILRDFQFKITFESYAPVYYGLNPRGRSSRSKSVDIVNVTDRDLDSYGYNFFENEEVMLDLVRWEIWSADVVSQVKDYGANSTLPVFSPLGSAHMWWSGSGNIHFRTSKPLFDKYFQGKKLDFAEWQASPPEKHVPADFQAHGYHPDPGEAARKDSAAPAPAGS